MPEQHADVPVQNGSVNCPACGHVILLGYNDDIPLPAAVGIVHRDDGEHQIIRPEPVSAARPQPFE